ncbi:MAG: D-2-hydroxyacid dehydrogenase [Cryomorphaceae bacterium]|nr:D-2-hydroxyacid dehydrogenase [Cryomorphaceae bacterium]
MKILANDGLNPAGVSMLEKNGFQVILNKVAQEQLINFINENQIAAILVRSATKVRKDIIDACPGLKLIGRGGVGMDNIDVAYAREKGIHVINTPAASSDSVAELAMAHLYGMVRFLPDSNRNMPLEGDKHFADLKKKYAKGQELKGKTLGLIGTGRIAMALAERAIGVGMKVIAHSPSGKNPQTTLRFFDGREMTFSIENISLDHLLAQSDFISLHVPKLAKPLIDKAAMDKMKDGSAIINTSRGGIVDEEALLAAIESGKIRYAALDVFDNEPQPAVKILMCTDISLSPHIGASTVEAQERIGEELAEQMITLLK